MVRPTGSLVFTETHYVAVIRQLLPSAAFAIALYSSVLQAVSFVENAEHLAI